MLYNFYGRMVDILLFRPPIATSVSLIGVMSLSNLFLKNCSSQEIILYFVFYKSVLLSGIILYALDEQII